MSVIACICTCIPPRSRSPLRPKQKRQTWGGGTRLVKAGNESAVNNCLMASDGNDRACGRRRDQCETLSDFDACIDDGRSSSPASCTQHHRVRGLLRVGLGCVLGGPRPRRFPGPPCLGESARQDVSPLCLAFAPLSCANPRSIDAYPPPQGPTGRSSNRLFRVHPASSSSCLGHHTVPRASCRP